MQKSRPETLNQFEQQLFEDASQVALKYLASEKTKEVTVHTLATLCSGYLSLYNLEMDYNGRTSKGLSTMSH